VHIVGLKKANNKRDGSISSISILKSTNAFLEIKALAKSNEVASQKVSKVVLYIQDTHKKILDDIRNRREFKISNINNKINNKIRNIEDLEIKLLTQKITTQMANLEEYRIQLSRTNTVIKDIEKNNPVLTALKLMEKRDISAFIIELNLQVMDMLYKKDELESMLLPHNYKNSEIVGKIITSDSPIKPKKKLIVAVAFIAGLILSIFLVFLINAFKAEDDKVPV